MKQFSLLILTLLFGACMQHTTPTGVLPLEKMAKLTEEITLIETYFQSKYGVASQYKKALDLSVDKTLKKAKCNRAIFKKSLQYYAAHPEKQKALNDTLLTSMSRKIN